MTVRDQWGDPLACADDSTVDAWNQAWVEALHFEADPFATLETANADDEEFVLGSVFCGLYRLLSGQPLDNPAVCADVDRATDRAVTARDRAHAAALQEAHRGNYTQAALRWTAMVREGRDFAAARFAHDVSLHVFAVDVMRESAELARAQWGTDVGWNFLAGQSSFALEESGELDQARTLGEQALNANPRDVWARHALAHVFETTQDQPAAMALLRDGDQSWTEQDGLAVHLWWHLSLRLLAAGALDEVLDLHDQLAPQATTAFRLCDLASLLWRVELAGGSVGDRWAHLADAFARRPEKVASAFIATHAALTYTRSPDHPEAAIFFGSLSAGVGTDAAKDTARGTGENGDIHATVVHPLATALRAFPTAPAQTAAVLNALGPDLERIGGSIAQRDLLALTLSNALNNATPESS